MVRHKRAARSGAAPRVLDLKKAVNMENPSIEKVKVRILPDGRLSRRDAASYLGRAEKTLAMWQMEGKGPRSVRVGGRIFYFKDDLDAFISGDT